MTRSPHAERLSELFRCAGPTLRLSMLARGSLRLAFDRLSTALEDAASFAFGEFHLFALLVGIWAGLSLSLLMASSYEPPGSLPRAYFNASTRLFEPPAPRHAPNPPLARASPRPSVDLEHPALDLLAAMVLTLPPLAALLAAFRLLPHALRAPPAGAVRRAPRAVLDALLASCARDPSELSEWESRILGACSKPGPASRRPRL